MKNPIPSHVTVGPYPDVGMKKFMEEFKPYLEELEALVDGKIKTLVNDIRGELKGNYLLSLPGLAAGSTPANVANAGFDFLIGGVKYAKAAVTAGTALSGDNVPEDKYGAWRLEIGADGTIDIVEAQANATGYISAALAVAGLPALSENHASMGVVTAVSDTGAFVPGTTSLGAANVTATFSDGQTAFQAIGDAIE